MTIEAAVQPGRRTGLWPPPEDAWLPASGVALIYAAHWWYGALVSDVALLVCMAAALLLGAVLLDPRLRADLLRLKGLAFPGVLFALVLAVALWTLTPWTPGGPHPAWAYVGIEPAASTIDRSSTLVETIKLLGLACLFLVGAATGARDERARYAVQLVILAGVAFGLWAFIASVSGAIFQTQGRRLEANFLNPNTAGTVFAVLLMLAVAEFRRQVRSRSRNGRIAPLFPLGAAALTFLVCLLASASRGAAMAFLGATLVFIGVQIATGGLRITRALAGAFAAVLALLGVLAFAGDRLVDRFFRFEQDAVVRTEIWRLHWEAFLDSPLFGYGLGAAETVNKTLLGPATFDTLWNIRAILNLYLQWLEEAGLVGAAPMFFCVGLIIAYALRRTLARSRMTVLLAGLLAADAVFLLHGITDFGLQTYSVAALFAWLLGLQFSLAQGSSRR